MVQRKLILFALLIFISLTFVSATTYQENNPVNIIIPTNSSSCHFTLSSPKNSSILILNQSMTIGEGYANYTVPASNTSSLGTYQYFSECGYGSFNITGTGGDFTTASSIFYIALLGLLIFLFIINAIGIARLPGRNARDDSGKILSVSKLKYFKSVLFVIAWGFIISILYISSSIANAYFIDQGFSNFLFTLFNLSTIFIYPFIILSVIWIIAHFIEDQKLQKLFERGVLE